MSQKYVKMYKNAIFLKKNLVLSIIFYNFAR